MSKGEAEDAESLLEKTLEADPEPQVKAWAFVYLGKLRLEVMDKEHAAQFFQQAMHVDGASEGALSEARQGLEKSLKQ